MCGIREVEMVKISVIIPCFNMERFLVECLNSILSQSLREIEAVCINDGSTDGTLAILKDYSQKDSRIIVLDQENLGVSAARNNGIKKALGNFICFMDPDDYYPNNTVLEKLYEACIQNGASICGGSFSEDIGGKVKTKFDGIYQKYTFSKRGFIDYRDYQFDYGYHRFIYQRDLLLKNDILFPPYIRFQDPPFFVRAMISAGRFYAIPEAVYRYRVGHQKLEWNKKRTLALLSGLADNMRMAKEAKLEGLQWLTLRRLFLEYKDKVSHLFYDEDVQSCLRKFQNEIDVNLLVSQKTNIWLDAKNAWQEIAALKQDLEKQKQEVFALKQDCDRQKQEVVALKKSFSYRTGKIVTWLPRKVYGGLKLIKYYIHRGGVLV